MSEDNIDTNKISRRDFLKVGVTGAAVMADTFLIRKIIRERQETEAHEKLSKPDIDIPPEQAEKITQIDAQLKNLREKILQSEGGVVPKLNSDGIFAIYFVKSVLIPAVRNALFVNPDDIKTWITEQGSYGYNFEVDKVSVTGGAPERQKQAREIFDAYLTADQFRVAKVELTDQNSTGPKGVQWEAGAKQYGDLKSPLPWNAYRAYIHELTHAGIPLNESKEVAGKSLLLPYGLRQTLDFVSDWVEAMNQEYDFFQKRFFRAEGDETLGMIRKEGVANFGFALKEIVAMCCADYIFPPLNDELFKIIRDKHEPLAPYPLTERAIRKSIAYVHYGVTAGNRFKDGIERRNGFAYGSFVGDLFWKILEFTK